MGKNFVYISNAFSLQMLTAESHKFESYPLAVGGVREFKRDGFEFHSAIGHPDTAAVVSDVLGFEVPANRVNLQLEKGDLLIVAQIFGGRLPEGVTKLPENFDLKFIVVRVIE